MKKTILLTNHTLEVFFLYTDLKTMVNNSN